MTDAALAFDRSPAPPMDGPQLASLLAAKLCHDFISPCGAIVSGLDLLDDPTAEDMREDALSLIGDSARKMVALVQFCRVAFGAATGSERFTGTELEALVEAVAGGGRATLQWRLDGGDYDRPAARVLVNLAYLTAAALPSGGVATVSSRRDESALVIEGRAEGARARLKPEATTGLAGERLAEGLAGQWIQPYWLWLSVREAGGALDVTAVDGHVGMTARIPS
jgi:histidine phosphotransferase ChpT